MSLLDDVMVWGEDQSPPDNTNIVQVLLYFSQEEAADFKRLSKAGMKIEFGKDFQTKGNLSDLLLILLKKSYGTNIPTQEPLQAKGV